MKPTIEAFKMGPKSGEPFRRLIPQLWVRACSNSSKDLENPAPKASEAGMDSFDREVGEAFEYQAKTERLLDS